MTTSYPDPSHDPITGSYIKPEDRVSPVAAAQTATAPDPYTIVEDDTATFSVGAAGTQYDSPEYYVDTTNYNASIGSTEVYNIQTNTEYNPDLDPRIHPELATGISTSEPVTYETAGFNTVTTSGASYDSNVVITEDLDPNLYASAVDNLVDTMPPAASHEHQHEIKETLDRILDQHIHLLHHQHETMQKLEEVSQKVDHLLEHMHQPMTGTLQIDCPQKVGAGYTV